MKRLLIILCLGFIFLSPQLFAQQDSDDVDVQKRKVFKSGQQSDDDVNVEEIIWVDEDGEKHVIKKKFKFIEKGEFGRGGNEFFSGGGCDRPCCADQGRGQSAKGMNSRKMGMGGHGRNFFGMLDLSDSQKKEIKDMKQAFQLEKIDLEAEIKKANIMLKSAMHDEASEREVFAAIDKVAKLKAEMKKISYSHKNDFKNILTDDQLKQLKEKNNEQGHRKNIEKKVMKKMRKHKR